MDGASLAGSRLCRIAGDDRAVEHEFAVEDVDRAAVGGHVIGGVASDQTVDHGQFAGLLEDGAAVEVGVVIAEVFVGPIVD